MSTCATCSGCVKADVDLSVVETVVAGLGSRRDALIPILHALQKQFGYLPQEALRKVCELTEITPADIVGVSTFYNHFRHRPVGRHVISVCHGTACHVKGAEAVSAALRRHLQLAGDDDTDARGLFTLQQVDCLGCCTLAPVVQIDGVTYGHLTSNTVTGVLEDFLELQSRSRGSSQVALPSSAADGLAEVRIGLGSCCIAGGSMQVREKLEEAIAELGAPAVVKPVGCVGMCHQTPLVEIVLPGREPQLYARVRAEDAPAIIQRHFKPDGVVRSVKTAVNRALEHLYTDEARRPVTRYALDTRDAPVCAFVGPQKHIATEYCGSLGPLDIDDYIAHGGFGALKRCVTELAPQAVIETIKASGLRGRGGAGFPTGEKWQTVSEAHPGPRYVVCNGDEGDPGAFMDRMLMESYPYRLIEGLAIAAHAVGAHYAVLYIRAEYPLAVQRIWAAIQACEERGLLGPAALDGRLNLTVGLMEGAGAFVCGEETGLLASLEGRRGTPRLRPPFPAQSGLWGSPTLVNNVETLCMVPWIIREGPEAFTALGTEGSAGTKVFSLTGKVERGGLIEVPMGVTIRQIVEEIGGGVAGGHRLKAVQIGGPSGGCIPAALADTPIDFEALDKVGAIMGSGGLVVIDDRDCMVDIARYFLQFTQRESCGKCTFCRIGTRRMLDILDKLVIGQGKARDIERLEELAREVQRSSLCGLGKTAPNPILSTLRHFRAEYLAHIEGRCPAQKCKALISYHITDDCIGCTLCARQCPAGAIAFKPHEKHAIDTEQCIRCGTCRELCPTDAVVVKSP